MKNNFFSKLFCASKRIKLCSPKKTNVIIFDLPGSDVIKRLILHDINHEIWPCRYDMFYLSPLIAIYFVKNLILKYFRYKKYRSLYLIYLLSCVEYVKPKIVITFIDYNSLFHAISEIYVKADFYAIQNGFRCKHNMPTFLPHPDRFGSAFSIKNLLCFGQYEIDLYREFDCSVRKFHPVGSLIGGWYKSKMRPSNPEIEFDLCLVSQWRKEIILEGQYPEDRKAIVTLDNYLSKIIAEKKLSLCIASCANAQEDVEAEIEYYKKTYGAKTKIIDRDRKGLSTYLAMDKSKLVLTFNSTAGYEAFGWGKKVLFCNFSGNRMHGFPMDGFWAVENKNYDGFRGQLEYLMEMDDSEYIHLTKAAALSVMNYDFSMPLHKYMRRIILERLGSGKMEDSLLETTM